MDLYIYQLIAYGFVEKKLFEKKSCQHLAIILVKMFQD